MVSHLLELCSKMYVSKHILRLLEIMLLFFSLVIVEKCLEYLLVVEDGFTQQLIEDFYQMDDNVDNIYLGSSHVHYNIKPEILDKITGENNFSLATGLQPMNTSYYLLKEADKDNEISHVYLELSCGLTTGEYGEFMTYEQLPNSWRVLDYVKPSFNKLEWILHISEPQHYYLSFLPARRYYKELLDGSHIASQLKNKAEDDATKWKGGYVYKGYRETEVVIDGMHCEKSKGVILDENPVTDDVIKYLTKIIDYCEENQIELTLFTSPILECELQNIRNYDNWGNQIRQLASERGVNYYDFNLCRTEYLDLYDEHYWRDNNHLNTWGAEVYTQFLGRVFEEEKSGTMNPYQYFYENHEQKMQNMEERIFGFTIDEVWNEEKNDYLKQAGVMEEDNIDYRVFLVEAVNNFTDEAQVEYLFLLENEENEHKQIIQDWSSNTICIVPISNDAAVLDISVRRRGDEQELGDKNLKTCKIVLNE